MGKTVAIMMALALAGCANAGAQMQLRSMPVEPVSLTPDQRQAVDNTLRGLMKDPDSVKIKNIVSTRRDGTIFVCGSINAKNSYGGYAGFSPFRIDIEEATGRTKVVSNPSSDADYMEKDIARAMCTAVGLNVDV
jgi:hypothetical protein